MTRVKYLSHPGADTGHRAKETKHIYCNATCNMLVLIDLTFDIL